MERTRKRAALAWIPTSVLKISRGFTLVEIMIVMVIIGGLIAVVAPKLQSTKSKTQQVLRQLVVLTRELHQNARLQNRNYRIAIKMDQKDGSSYSVESSPDPVLLLSEEQREEALRSLRGREDKAPPSKFSVDSKIIKGERKLPKELKIEAVQTAQYSEPVNDGTAYIHFFAQGTNEEAIINLTAGGETHWSIIIHPLTGVSRVESRFVNFKELHP